MKAPQASLATLDVLPAKGRAGVREGAPNAAPPPAPPPAPPAKPSAPRPVGINLRLSRAMHGRLKTIGQQDGRSLNKVILDALAAMLDGPGPY